MPFARRFSLVLAVAAIGLACDNNPTSSQNTPTGCLTPVGTIALGDTLAGTLSASSCTLSNGAYAETRSLVLSTTTIITLRLELASDEFDTVLYVRDASGTLVVLDDDSGPDTDSRIEHTFSPGTYRLIATSYDRGEIGNYTISVVQLVVP